MCKPLHPGLRRDDSNRRVVIEWIPTSWRTLPAGTVTTHGFVVRLKLPPTMVVVSQNVESFQVCQCVAPAFRCETGRENTVVRVISLTIQSVYSVAML